MEALDERKLKDKILDYLGGGSLGIAVTLGYLVVGIGATLYLLYLVTQFYLWNVDFGIAYGLFWGFILALLAFFGIIVATGLGLGLIFYAGKRYQDIGNGIMRILRYFIHFFR